jgi:osmoprotectant transport system ATP-binding protein
VTHDVREAFLLGTRIGLMKAGSLSAIVDRDSFLKLEDPEARAFARCLQ